MTIVEQKEIIKQYQQETLNANFETDCNFGDEILHRLMVFSIPKSPRKKLVMLSNHRAPKVELDLLIKSLVSADVYHHLSDWAGTVEYYSAIPIENEAVKSFCQQANTQGISMQVYDYAHLINNELLKCLIEDTRKYEYQGLDAYKRGLLEILAYGATSTNVKQRIVESFLLHTLYKNKEKYPSISKNDIIQEFELEKYITQGDANIAISSLSQQKLIEKDPLVKHNIRLSSQGKAIVREAKSKSLNEEACFKAELNVICEKYKISSSTDDVLTYLRNYATSIYGTILINKEEPNPEGQQILRTYLESVHVSDVIACMQDLEILCRENPFLSRISVGDIFINNISDQEIEEYTNQTKKIIYLDTPIIVYWLCYLAYLQPKNNDWENSRYLATRELINFIANHGEEIQLSIRYSYLGEVAGEIQKAIRLQILDQANFPIKFSTNNTFYQYYQFVKDSRGLRSFTDFLNEIGLSDKDADNIHFIERTANSLQKILTNVWTQLLIDNYIYPKEQYEGIASHLPDKYIRRRNVTPIRNDIEQVLQIQYAINKEDSCSYFVATWDEIFCAIRERVQETDPRCVFYVSSPTQLASQLSMAHFNISADVLTDAMWITADTTDAIKRLYDNVLSLLIDTTNERSLNTLQKLIEAQIAFMETSPVFNEQLEEQGYPLENVIDTIFSLVSTECEKSKYILRKYINDEEQFDTIKADLDAGYEEIRNQQDYYNGEAIKLFKEHFLLWAEKHPDVDTLREENENE